MFKNSEYNTHPESIVGKPVEIRLAHARDLDSSPGLLKVLAKDSFWFIRDLVASNASTPIDCLAILTKDADFRVRAEAENTLSRLRLGKQDPTPTLQSLVATADIIRANQAATHNTIHCTRSFDRQIDL